MGAIDRLKNIQAFAQLQTTIQEASAFNKIVDLMIVVILIAIFSMTFVFLMYYGYYEALSGDY